MNALTEIEQQLWSYGYGFSDVEAIEILWREPNVPFKLIVQKRNPSFEDLLPLDFHYESFAPDPFWGTVWMKDGAWFERNKDAYGHGWVLCMRPEITF